MNAKASLVCSDISEEMVKFGKEKYKDNGRVSYIKLDIETPHLPEDLVQHFDHAKSFCCIHWCQDMRRVFGNILDLLRPGGTAFLSFVANHSVYDTYPVLAAIPRYQPDMMDPERYVPAYQNDEHRCKTESFDQLHMGFEVHHCSLRENIHIFETPKAVDKFLLALNPFIERMPADLKNEYKKDLAEEFIRRNLIFNRNEKSDYEYSVRCIYHVFVVYFKKPVAIV